MNLNAKIAKVVNDEYLEAVKNRKPIAQEPLLRILFFLETGQLRDSATEEKWEEYVELRHEQAEEALQD